MSYNSSLEADIKQAVASSNEELWKHINIQTEQDPLAGYVKDLSRSQNWSFDRFAAVLIYLLLTRSEEWRQQIIDLYAMKPPAPILVTVSQERMKEIRDQFGNSINDLGNTPLAQAQMDALAEAHDRMMGEEGSLIEAPVAKNTG